MKQLFNQTYENKTVFITGHTGFKGSWLSLWLTALGAKVVGYSLPPTTTPSHFDLINLAEIINQHITADIRDAAQLQNTIQTTQPDIIFHLAAQPLVIESYLNPQETFATNVMGTVNLLEAARECPNTKAIIVVTSDKCYDNQEWIWGYRETDKLGGKDPYSASKSMAEIAVNAYRHSFFNHSLEKTPASIATVRAGNVIGGGDFSENRIVPDCMRGLMEGKTIFIRNPKSVRPWLHVLDPLTGYLQLGAKMYHNGQACGGAWNFGPIESEGITVESIVEKAIELWRKGNWEKTGTLDTQQECSMLRLNWDKAANKLGWHPVYNWEEAIEETVLWTAAYDQYQKNPQNINLHQIGIEQIKRYVEKAEIMGLPWIHHTRSHAI